MSYDYMNARLRKPAAELNDLSPESCWRATCTSEAATAVPRHRALR